MRLLSSRLRLYRGIIRKSLFHGWRCRFCWLIFGERFVDDVKEQSEKNEGTACPLEEVERVGRVAQHRVDRGKYFSRSGDGRQDEWVELRDGVIYEVLTNSGGDAIDEDCLDNLGIPTWSHEEVFIKSTNDKVGRTEA